MKLVLIFLSFFLNGIYAQPSTDTKQYLTVSPLIDKEQPSNKLIISALNNFLQTKNSSLSDNEYWLKSDFQKFVYPYFDIYNIEQSKFGNDFYKPTLMEILATENADQKIVKLAFIGHNATVNENLLKSIYNLVANINNGKIVFSKYLDIATSKWTTKKVESVNYIISPYKSVNTAEIEKQTADIKTICTFFNTNPIDITYYSCIDPKELFKIKGFDYNPMMYVDESGGLAEHGNIIFSGNNSEIYTHEIVHIYTNNLYPNGNKFLDEGIATYLAGSGKYDYKWHRNKLAEFLAADPTHDFAKHTEPYERFYFQKETPIPYLAAALICERTIRIFGNEKLLQLLKSPEELWTILKTVGLTKDNINLELRKELMLPIHR